MTTKTTYEAAFDRYIDLLETRREMVMQGDFESPLDPAYIELCLEIQSAETTAELLGKAAGIAEVAADIPF